MTQTAAPPDDSLPRHGGLIPGAEGRPAFTLRLPEPSRLPVLIAVPHAGRAYPGSLIEQLRHPGHAALRLEDRMVDRLAERVADATGAALLVAQAPRAMIDLNRAPDEVDRDMLAHGQRAIPDSYAPSRRVRSGLGLIPRRLAGLGELWKRRLAEGELAARIESVHAPYHACLAETLARLRRRWGAALLIDLHSMPPLGQRDGQPPPEIVLGDRFGASCGGALVASCFAYFAATRSRVAHNHPYAGGYVLDRHADPDAGIHALQIEVDRSCYLDARLADLGPGMEPMAEVLSGLVRRLASEVADAGRAGRAGLDQAAE